MRQANNKHKKYEFLHSPETNMPRIRNRSASSLFQSSNAHANLSKICEVIWQSDLKKLSSFVALMTPNERSLQLLWEWATLFSSQAQLAVRLIQIHFCKLQVSEKGASLLRTINI